MLWAAGLVVGFHLACIAGLFALRYWDPPTTAVQVQTRIALKLEGIEAPFRQRSVALRDVPLTVQRAVIAAEDGAFYSHRGVDWAELQLALDKAADGGRLRGASTITQQLVKNLFLTNARFPPRKLPEYVLTPFAERILGKERILELYLNQIEWGPNVWGVAAAAEHHYGVSVRVLNREQVTRLAACIPSPRKRKPAQMSRYASIIDTRMRARGW
jgi:monofunctional glycosyltransferase